MRIQDILGDLHCNMDHRSEDLWLNEHVRDEDYPYKLYIEPLDKILAERRARETYRITGERYLDTKRYHTEIDGTPRIVRVIEYLTRRAVERTGEHPEESHEWHKFLLIFDAEDFIIGMIPLPEGAVIENRPISGTLSAVSG